MFFIEGDWKCTRTHIENNKNFQNFLIFSPSWTFFILLTSTFTTLSSPTPMFSHFLATFFQTNHPANLLTSLVNGPIPANVSPRSYTRVNFLVYKVDPTFFTLYIKPSSCNSVSFPNLDSFLHLSFKSL